MAALGMAAEAANARLVQERVERTREQLAQLQEQIERYDTVAETLSDLPKKLSHPVMVPLGKRAMMPGKLVRTNEVLAHLGDDYFAWRTAADAVEVIARKKKALSVRMESEEETLRSLEAKQGDAGSVAQLQKMYEAEGIREIQETEAESELGAVPHATDEDVKEYFELEEEERQKAAQASWNWDDMMKRMEELEASEAAAESEDSSVAPEVEQSVEAQAVALKAKGNDAFARRRFQAATQFYSQAIELDPTSHLLYGNRAAAYHRLKKYELALADADAAIALHEPWVKGHYRKACALAALERFEDAADAFERAMELCPTDKKLEEKAKLMRQKAEAKVRGPTSSQTSSTTSTPQPAPVPMPTPAPTPTPAPELETKPATTASPSLTPPAPVSAGAPFSTSSSSSAAFSGSIMERKIEEHKPRPMPTAAEFAEVDRMLGKASPSPAAARGSRFQGNNYMGQTVSLEPVGEAQPVKRVSRFKAARAGRRAN